MTERVDNFLVGDKRVSVSCMGVFELRGGKIAAWRDYWDLQQFERQLPKTAGGVRKKVEVLRLLETRASRSSRSAQDDIAFRANSMLR